MCAICDLDNVQTQYRWREEEVLLSVLIFTFFTFYIMAWFGDIFVSRTHNIANGWHNSNNSKQLYLYTLWVDNCFIVLFRDSQFSNEFIISSSWKTTQMQVIILGVLNGISWISVTNGDETLFAKKVQ